MNVTLPNGAYTSAECYIHSRAGSYCMRVYYIVKHFIKYWFNVMAIITQWCHKYLNGKVNKKGKQFGF